MLFNTQSSSPGQYSFIKAVKTFVMIFDTALRTSTIKYKYLTWNWTAPTTITNTTKFTYKLAINPDKRCIVNFKDAFTVLNINTNPYFTYTYNSGVGAIQCETNACSNTTIAMMSAFCWFDASGCPATYPYKSTTSDLCYDCVGFTVVQASKLISLFRHDFQ